MGCPRLDGLRLRCVALCAAFCATQCATVADGLLWLAWAQQQQQEGRQHPIQAGLSLPGGGASTAPEVTKWLVVVDGVLVATTRYVYPTTLHAPTTGIGAAVGCY